MDIDDRVAFDLALRPFLIAAVPTPTTAREREIAAHLMDGLTSKEIGKSLCISHSTVEIYRSRLMRKYKASNTGDLVRRLMAGG